MAGEHSCESRLRVRGGEQSSFALLAYAHLLVHVSLILHTKGFPFKRFRVQAREFFHVLVPDALGEATKSEAVVVLALLKNE